MWEGYQLVAMLIGIGVLLFMLEMILPTHGVLGLLGGVAILWAVFAATWQNVWAGLALLVAVAAATPVVWMAFIKVWPKTPVGKRLILQDVPEAPQELAVRIGQSGVVVNELLPMGTCEFDGVRVESLSEHGVVPAGTAVKVVALVNNRPTVRIA